MIVHDLPQEPKAAPIGARARTVAFEGVDERPIDTQVQISGGIAALTNVRAITTLEH
jgi:hypothetical protein